MKYRPEAMSRAARRSEAVERFAERGRQRLWAERVSEYPVAPRAGAWIETLFGAKNLLTCRCPSRPARARGLKLATAATRCGRRDGRAPRGRVD